ncbi:MAG: hypothetical protein Q4G04_01590 [bacterium]|nr:hypothetical protein [bacterium]
MAEFNLEYHKGILFVRIPGYSSKEEYKFALEYLKEIVLRIGIKYLVITINSVKNFRLFNKLLKSIVNNCSKVLICYSHFSIKQNKILTQNNIRTITEERKAFEIIEI